MMTLRYFLLAAILLVSLSGSALRVIFDYRVFHAPGEGPYVEITTSFDAATFAHQPLDSGMVQAHAEITILISKLDKIIDVRKVKVDGPVVKANDLSDFLSLERFMLPGGVYDLEVEITDLVDPLKKSEKLIQKVEINNPSTGVFVSDIEFVSAYRPTNEMTSFTKAGYDMLPYVSSYFGSSLNSIIFYSEIYRTDSVFGAGSAFLSSICVVDAMDNAIETCMRMKREKSAPVVPLLQVMDITDLPTGEYRIRIEVKNRENQVVYLKERPFTRNKINAIPGTAIDAIASKESIQGTFVTGYQSADELYAILLYHLPIAGDIERNTIDHTLKNADLESMQGFLYTFWAKRNSENPEAAWKAYEANIRIVKENFETRIKPGWQTERGRVYLQYGKPNTRVIRHNDADYWPFEIWHYYETDSNLHNRRFLFYDTNLMGDMELLHSDVPSEVKNFNWKEMVRSRPAALNMTDAARNNANQRTDPNSRDEIENLWYSPH